jgi:hypothetical protein
MAYFATYDHTAEEPMPITGWYDSRLPYKQRFAPADLMPITDKDWQLHIDHPLGWHVQEGKLVRIE